MAPSFRDQTAKQQAAAARCAAMVSHARVLIGAVGVERFSVNEVLRLSGGSKATLVKYFGGRDGLISAAIGEEARAAMASLRLGDGDAVKLPLAEGLHLLLGGVLRFYMMPASLALYRAVISMGVREQGTAKAFYDHGHRVLVDAIADFLRTYATHREGPETDLTDIADQMVHVIRAGLHERAVLGLWPEAADDQAIEERVRRSLALLLPGVEVALRD
ncbi:TetR/AcrR family transcriptional regulator C-terminal domain-containing protein [Sphingobium sp. HBC34]|uniref:TetR/AcrR family transcriptional regulator C-terminal domain-containing protein n=1 Tax=Sphingobium cyanobacteriorum TaxID=3063954 RepID=A0ABT8ZPN9_9SPHN|nr:TetR/AcrR family transcriptional regulator C-terminal domain-containing protein [Sphingobium sp. HBC34]MDO7836152.1 TetR/AcrR family transcriptional regulator C-terminal domain-containing protein [Sphingobium sp. HBC34]